MKNLGSFVSLIASLLFLAGCSTVWTASEVPFVPTPPEVIDRMLELAEVKADDVVYDLGSGDGRIVIRAAKTYGVKGVGIEIDPDLVRRSRLKAGDEGVGDLVEFRDQDALTVDVSPASVVTLYMLPDFNAKLRPIFERQLKPGSRVVSHDFPIQGWTPNRVEKLEGPWYHTHTIYLWKIP
jgi:cyclopropane fatty-acyl-phospholipid synthase-like methyltransferase